jgi:hypothetical protein
MTPIDPVLISLIRNVMPNIIANDIIGVSPMASPTSSIFKLRKKYGSEIRNPMNKALYKTFLRVNDRPRSQPLRAFLAAGYPIIEVAYRDAIPAIQWCREQFGDDGFQRFDTTLVFRDEEAAMAFRMRWL